MIIPLDNNDYIAMPIHFYSLRSHQMINMANRIVFEHNVSGLLLFQIPAEHLLCASVMNAPVGLAVSKLFYPEVEISEQGRKQEIKLGKG